MSGGWFRLLYCLGVEAAVLPGGEAAVGCGCASRARIAKLSKHLPIPPDQLAEASHPTPPHQLAPLQQVNYREGISRAAEVRYVHKKQSGGSGQFADVAIRFEPGEVRGTAYCGAVLAVVSSLLWVVGLLAAGMVSCQQCFRLGRRGPRVAQPGPTRRLMRHALLSADACCAPTLLPRSPPPALAARLWL